jgi:transcriptional regulator with PAS, ATPase and Fis domain
MTKQDDTFIGEHPSMLEVGLLIDRVAASPIRTVLVYGETGTGKGMLARRLHNRSKRRNASFVDVNCAAIPATLLESELFGHQRGAFTGAISSKKGLIEIADGGTVFLDEIREMDLSLQAKLLGLLDTQSFRPIGAIKQTAVDVRFVAATNQVLLSEVKRGAFREDLYYRLQVVAINLPALRDRGDDVFVLMSHFLRVFSERYGRVVTGCEPAVREVFQKYRWPGNVRELENLVERIFVLEHDKQILMRHLPARITRDVEIGPLPAAVADSDESPPTHRASSTTQADLHSLPFKRLTAEYQRTLVREALKHSSFRLDGAARLLDLTRHSLRHQMRKLGIALDGH